MKMQSNFLCALTLFLSASFGMLHAQDNNVNTEFGVKGGFNMSNLYGSGDDVDDNNILYGFNAGVYATLPISDFVAIQPEILYSAQGSKSEGPLNIEGDIYDVKATLKMNYINVPVMFKYQIADKFSLEAGPYVGFLTKAKLEFDIEGLGSGTEDMKDNVKSTDFGIGVGMNYEFSDVIFANARYQAGLTEIGDSEAGGNNIKNSVFQIGLGFRF